MTSPKFFDQVMAVFGGPNDCYRHSLRREWNGNLPVLCAMGCNPSTADAEKNDPTVRLLILWAKQWKYGGLCLWNMYGWRDTDPTVLAGLSDPIGAANESTMRVDCLRLGNRINKVLCCWGDIASRCAMDDDYRKALANIRRVTHEFQLQPIVLGLTISGNPRHPLRVPFTTEPQPWQIPQ